MAYETQYAEDKKMLGLIREMNGDGDVIAITDNAKFGNSVLSVDKNAFRSNVAKDASFDEAPALYYSKSEDDLFFRGRIPTLGNLKWQFRLRDANGDGCYISTENGENGNIRLNNENLKTLSRLYGYYKMWQDNWNKDNKLEYLKRM